MDKKAKITAFFHWLKALLERMKISSSVAHWLAVVITGALVAAAVALGVLTLDSCAGTYKQNGIEVRLEFVPVPVTPQK